MTERRDADAYTAGILARFDATDSQSEAETGEIGVPCEVYSRVVGYLRPISSWNAAKRGEFHERKMFRVEV